MDKETKREAIVVFIGFMLIFAPSCYYIATNYVDISPSHSYIKESHELYYASIPIGEYYTDVDGRFILGSGLVSSSLGEGYVLKYYEYTQYGKELKTFIIDSTDEHVHVISSTEHKFEIWSIYDNWDVYTEYRIYVPMLG